MSKRHGKQTTLFQTWSRSQDVAKTSDPKPGTSSSKQQLENEIFQMEDDDDDVILLDAMTKTLRRYENEESSKRNTINASPGSILTSCSTESLPGFDLSAGDSWIYPTNYSVRDYQYNIVHASLFKNTLVTLPTGLGKTFIAAVVMFNYYRWYPSGKVVFMAPTRPLVAQQIEACYNIMGIPQQDTVEMTGK